MAKFNAELPNELIKELQNLEQDTEKMMAEMTVAGAKAVSELMKKKAPKKEIADNIKLTKTYKTPTDNGINTKVYISGYIPFSDPKRKYFARRGGNGKMYYSDKGVPLDFLSKLYEYGRKDGVNFPKQPFVRTSFNKSAISSAMLQVQDKYIPKG